VPVLATPTGAGYSVQKLLLQSYIKYSYMSKLLVIFQQITAKIVPKQTNHSK
jgi:hypothetical protein